MIINIKMCLKFACTEREIGILICLIKVCDEKKSITVLYYKSDLSVEILGNGKGGVASCIKKFY